MTLGAFVSSCFAGPIASVMGRRASIWSAALLCAGSNTIMMASTNIGAIYVGRFLIGLANGMFMTFAQLYIQVRDEIHIVSESVAAPPADVLLRRSLYPLAIEA